MTVFQVHFMMLPNKGSGGDYMSPEFQQTFNTDKSVETFADVGYNSHILIKHSGTRGGYLHSHKDTYPAGSKQQQITLYGWSDDNSIFIVRPAIQDKDGALSEVSLNETSFTKITDGTVVRLQHLTTKKYLHSHNVRAPVSTNGYYNEVSGYGGSDFIGDTNDNWIVKVDGGGDLQAVVSRVRFLHQRTRCELFSHEVKLPDWGFYQQVDLF